MSALLALSDVLVVRALERACGRAIPGDVRRRMVERSELRHRAYQHFPIPAIRHAHALDGAWDVTVEITTRWRLPVDADEWSRVLDAYCRTLLRTQQPHTLDRLEDALTPLGAGSRV